MSNAIEKKQAPPHLAFREFIEKNAGTHVLEKLVDSDAARKAAGRTALAYANAARTAKDPAAIYSCSQASIMTCVVNSAVTGLMPGGAHPVVWLVPKKGELQWWLSHRGICTLALRAGYNIIAVPVHVDDEVEVEFGEVTRHEADPESWANKLDDLKGVYVCIKRLSDGALIGRPWLPIGAIKKRSAKAMTQSVWNEWPVEQAQKTAIKWVIARGFLPLDDQALQEALSAEPVDYDESISEAPKKTREKPSGRAALGLSQDFSEEARIAKGSEPEAVTIEVVEEKKGPEVVVERKPEPQAPEKAPPKMDITVDSSDPM